MPLIVVFLVIFLAQVVYLLLLHCGFRLAVRSYAELAGGAGSSPAPISVVVAARNEEQTLPDLLAALAKQTHPDHEVVVVDDASADRSRDVVRSWQERMPNLRLVEITNPQPPRKKHALTAGIAAARHDLLALTDADCTPPTRWLESIAPVLSDGDNDLLLVGYSPFRRGRGLLNRFSRYETLFTGYLTASAVGLGQPYMAVGRNIFYSKAVFARAGGFTGTLRSLSGDDDLFVQQVRERAAARIEHVFGPESYVPTDAPPTWRAWFRQKIRHTSAGRFYPRGAKLHLTLYHATHTLLWVAPAMIGWWGVLLLATRMALHFGTIRAAAREFGEGDLLPTQPLLEFLYMLYNVFVAPLGLVRMPSRW